MKKVLGCFIIVTIIFILQPAVTKAAKYILSNPSEISFKLDTEKDLYNGIVSKYIDDTTQKEDLYIKIIKTKVKSITCNGHSIALVDNNIDDGYIVTRDYGKMKIGFFGPPPHTVRVWLTKKQLKALKALKSKHK